MMKFRLISSEFEKPVYLIITNSYKIRIDRKAKDTTRYASWKIKSKKREPDIVIENGVLEFQGSGGNHTITFHNIGYTYIVSINEMRDDDESEATIEILQKDKKILKENGKIIRN